MIPLVAPSSHVVFAESFWPPREDGHVEVKCPMPQGGKVCNGRLLVFRPPLVGWLDSVHCPRCGQWVALAIRSTGVT